MLECRRAGIDPIRRARPYGRASAPRVRNRARRRPRGGSISAEGVTAETRAVRPHRPEVNPAPRQSLRAIVSRRRDRREEKRNPVEPAQADLPTCATSVRTPQEAERETSSAMSSTAPIDVKPRSEATHGSRAAGEQEIGGHIEIVSADVELRLITIPP